MFTRRANLLPAIGLWMVTAIAVLLLARGLPARTFFSGDSGVKLVVVKNAIRHPAHPLDIELPRVANQPVDLLDPFFHVEGAYAHAATPDLFPLLSAPLIARFGMRGAFILPAIGYLLTIWMIASLGVALDERRSRAMLLFVAIACTPLLFYGLEFWEHTVASGVAATATVLCVTARSKGRLFVSGALLGIAVLLRPEAAWYAAGVVIAVRWLPRRSGFVEMMTLAAGGAVGFLPFAAASAASSGQLFGTHVTRNMSGLTSHWWSSRLEYLGVWFLPHDSGWLIAAVALCLIALVASRKERFIRTTSIIGALFVAVVAIAAATGHFDRSTIWNAAPAVLAILVIPHMRVRNGNTFLLTVSVVSALLVVLTSPSEGGAQWGPRYFSLTFIPLAILMADALTTVVENARVIGTAVTIVVLTASLLIQRNAYKELQGAKRTYERIVERVERETSPGSYIVTDLWWFDQVTAVLYPTRVILFAGDATATTKALSALTAVPEFFVIRSDTESPNSGLADLAERPPFSIARQMPIADRSLTFLGLVKRP